jgi:hypothetical protein
VVSPDTPMTLAAIARPGDTVILAFQGYLSDEDIDALTESFQHLKEKGVEIAFTDQVISMVVVRPEVEE